MIHVGAIGQVTPGNTARSFAAYRLDSDGAFALVTPLATWTSSNSTVVRITGTSSAPSTFVAVAPGAATITARYEDVTASFPIVVIESAPFYPRLVLTLGNPGLVGRVAQASATLEASATAARESVTTRVAWTSSEAAVATIDQNGTIRAVGVGATVITASLGNLTQFYWLSVAPGP